MTATFNARKRAPFAPPLRANAPLELEGYLFTNFEAMALFVQTYDYIHDAIGITEAVEGWDEYRIDFCQYLYNEAKGYSINIQISGVEGDGEPETEVTYPFGHATGHDIIGLKGL